MNRIRRSMKKSKRLLSLERQVREGKRRLKNQKLRQRDIELEIKKNNSWYEERANSFRDELILKATKSERLLLQALLKSSLAEEVSFQSIIYLKRKSRIIKFYIADFLLTRRKLIIEVDGGYHSQVEQQAKDVSRDLELKKLGYSTLRLSNELILSSEENRRAIIERIKTI